MNKPIYFNNCLTSKPVPEVIEAMLPYWQEKFYFPENFISKGTEIENDIAGFKKIVADSINAKPQEIHFTSGGTSANNLAIKGYLMANSHKGNHIICSKVDYPDLLTNAAFFEKSGFEVTYLDADEEGFIDLKQLKKAIKSETIMFMTTWANHTTGTLQPIAKISQILQNADHQIAFHVDAGQAYGKIPIDVEEMNIDLLSISAHKIHGPVGIGALYLRSGIQLAPTKHGINRIDEFETGGINIGLISGFVKAIELNFSKFEENNNKLRELSNYLLKKIEDNIPHTLLNGPRGEKRAPHNVNISFRYIEGEAIMMMLDAAGIIVATGSACFSKGLKANYILMAIGRNHEESHGSMKFTISRYNTKEEIDYTVEKLEQIVKELRNRSPLYKKEK
ncbi:MAG: cysteine desulfurase family protein [Candidatus Cloacimonadota bacterium]|nr:cysteine desulfurase family protein [Candidatus Cloacimonadota bacterium]